MLKRRLIPVLYIKNGLIVRSENFEEHKIIGNVVNELERYNEWDIDELFYIDISRSNEYDSRRNDHKVERVTSIDEILNLISKKCFMPLTFGGGIRDIDTIKKYLSGGADKIVVNTLIHENPEVVSEAIKLYGSQAVVAALDYRIIDNEIVFFINNGSERLEIELRDMAKKILDLGCGELLITSMDNDGNAEGYDLENLSKIASHFNKIPVVICGGAITADDFIEASTNSDYSGIAAGNMFHFTENIYRISKSLLKKNNFNYR